MFGGLVVRQTVVVLLLGAASLRAEWNTKDFLKREHSLVKPYQVNLVQGVLLIMFHLVFGIFNPLKYIPERK